MTFSPLKSRHGKWQWGLRRYALWMSCEMPDAETDAITAQLEATGLVESYVTEDGRERIG
jgi:hypothetical protein